MKVHGKDPDRARKLIDDAFDFLDGNERQFSSWSNFGGRSVLAGQIVYKTREISYPDLHQMFPIGTAIGIAGAKRFLKPDALGEKIEVHRRPEAVGEIEFTLTRSGKAKPTDVKLSLTSEWGEWVPLTGVERIEKLPVGRYRIESLEFNLAEGKYENWSYRFYNPGSKLTVEVRDGKRTVYELLPDFKLQFDVDGKGKDDTAFVTPVASASNGLRMSTCAPGEKANEYKRDAPAEILLNAEGSVMVAKERSEFQCGALPMTPIRIPEQWRGGKLEVVVTLPTGPLAGDLNESRELRVREKK